VRWYVTYKLSYRDVCDLMAERGVTVVHNHSFAMGPTLRSRLREKMEELRAPCRLILESR
jgi:transposase-like protein